MDVTVRADREGDRARLIPMGQFDLAHAVAAARAIANIETALAGCRAVELDLTHVDDIDGTGAAQLARLLDHVEAAGPSTHVLEEHNPRAARLIVLYRQRRTTAPVKPRRYAILARFGSFAAQLPRALTSGLHSIGHDAVAVRQAVAAPRSVDWRSLPQLVQQIGADGLPVASAANLLVGLIIGFLGVSQLGRFGVTVYVPELVVVAHFRELGPLVTAIVVAGRSGAGLASEIATMKVSEEIDALRSMGFDPDEMAGCAAVPGAHPRAPGITWVGDLLALLGGMIATTSLTDMSARAYVTLTARRHQRDELPGGTCQDPVPGSGDRSDCVWSGARHAGRCGRSRCQNDHGRRAVDLRRHRDQLPVHLSVRRDRPVIMPRSRPHIIVNDLRIGWGSHVLMQHVTFDVDRGTTLAILGGSGSGKSTLLRYLIGLETPLAGTIDIDGLGAPDRYEGVPRFGVLFQSGALFSSMTLAENLALPLTTWTSVRGAS